MSITIQTGAVGRGADLPPGDYFFQVGNADPYYNERYHMALLKAPLTAGGWRLIAGFNFVDPLTIAAGFTHGWWVPKMSVTLNDDAHLWTPGLEREPYPYRVAVVHPDTPHYSMPPGVGESDDSRTFLVAQTDGDWLLVIPTTDPRSQMLTPNGSSWHATQFDDRSGLTFRQWYTPGVHLTYLDPPPPVTPCNPPFDYGQLTLVDEFDGFNLHVDKQGDNVYLQHVTGKVLVDFDEINVPDEWSAYQREGLGLVEFADWLKDLTWEHDRVDDEVRSCDRCSKAVHGDDLSGVMGGDEAVCDKCLNDYRRCGNCDESYLEGATVASGGWRCDGCLEEYYSFCDDCDTYYPDDEGHSHDDEDSDYGCECEAPAQKFTVRNDGNDPLANDTRATLSLGAGEISDEGMLAIRRAIRGYANEILEWSASGFPVYRITEEAEREKVHNLARDLVAVGNRWQAKDGNFTKRLSRHAYKNHQVKLPPAVISEVGNIATAHSRGSDYELEVTRNLNLPPGEFGNEGSCWWNESGYRRARCALKSNGGFGLRTFDPAHEYGVAGRAWVQPLRWTGNVDSRVKDPDSCQDESCCTPRYITVKTGFTPTFETEKPDAFIVFNGYGNLADYAAARIVAHMAGMTYRKVEFNVDIDEGTYYVNSDTGYLIAPEELADKYTDGAIRLSVDHHSDLFNTEAVTAAIDSTTEITKEHAHV